MQESETNSQNPNKKAAILLAAAAVALIVLIMGAIVLLPYDIPSQVPANSSGNLMNGGFAALDVSLLYYIDENGALICKSDNSVYKIADNGCDMINPYKSSVIYRQNGSIMQSAFTGSGKKELAKNISSMLVSGNWIYYADTAGELHKTKIGSGKIANLGLSPKGQFTVAGTSIFFVGDKGYLYTATTDGKNVTPFLGEKVDRFMIYESFLYYLSNGKVCSIVAANSADKNTYEPADEFHIVDETLMYTKGGKLFSLDLNDQKAKPKSVDTKTESVSRLSVCDSRLYFYDNNGYLHSIRKDGSEDHVLKNNK